MCVLVGGKFRFYCTYFKFYELHNYFMWHKEKRKGGSPVFGLLYPLFFAFLEVLKFHPPFILQLLSDNSAYSVSKIGVNRLTQLQAEALNTDPRHGILINSVSTVYCIF